MDIHNGHLHSPYFIFIRSVIDQEDSNQMDDDALIKSLIIACQKVKKGKNSASHQHDVFVTKTGSWIHIMDDWSYSLWNNPDITTWIEELGETREIFTCAAGEIDDSHEWAYFNDGGLQRAVEFHVNNKGVLEKKVDYGVPLAGEWKANLQADVLDKVLGIAESLGINLEQSEAEVWSYSFLNGKIVNTKEVFKRQEKTAAQRREDSKVKRGGKQILLGLFALTLLIIFGGYHYFNEEALANRLSVEEQAAFEQMMAGPKGNEIRRQIYIEKIKFAVQMEHETSVTIHLDSIYQDSLPSEIFKLGSIEELIVLPSTKIDEYGERAYQLKFIDPRISKNYRLENLILENHGIVEVPEELGMLMNLKFLNLRGNNISISYSEQIQTKLPQDCRLEF